MKLKTFILWLLGAFILLFFILRYFLAAPRGLEPRWVMDLSSQHQALTRTKLHHAVGGHFPEHPS